MSRLRGRAFPKNYWIMLENGLRPSTIAKVEAKAAKKK